jgi:hypothetical protein
VTDGIHFYVQGAGNLKTNQSYADYLVLQGTTINTQNPFLLQPYRTAFANAGQATFTMNQLAMNGPRLGTISKTSQLNLAAGFNGKIGDFDWTVDYVRGQSILKTTQVNNVNSQYLAEALDATTNGSGQIVCRTALTKTTSCTPFNPFGGAASAASYSYFMRDTHYRAITKLDDVTASVSGSPFETWAGPVKMAVSGEWRLISFSSQSDATPSDFATCTGLPSNCSTTNPPLLWLNTFPASPRISNTVWEGAVEANVPLLKDIPLIQSFDLSGAARYTSYRTSGQYWTWKVGIDWHLTDTLRVRGTRSRDIRAPTLNDLFAPSFVSIVNPTDGLTGLAPRVSGNNFSNPNLKAEVGNTFTVGMVWRPSPKFNVAVDYYNITIRNAITQLQGQTSQIQALCYASDGSSPYCSLQTRANGSVAAAIAAYNANPSSVIGNAAYSPTSWVSQSINLSSIRTMGVDVEANFQSTLFDRPFAARFLAAYQPHIYYSQPGVPTSDQGGAAFGPLGAAAAPTVRLTGMVHFEPVDGIGIDILERWRNPMKLSGVPGEFWVNNHLPAFATTNINIAFKPKSAQAFEFYVNVQNLFDAMPPTGSYTGNGTRAGYRDGYPVGDNPIGRFFTAGVRAKF